MPRRATPPTTVRAYILGPVVDAIDAEARRIGDVEGREPSRAVIASRIIASWAAARSPEPHPVATNRGPR